MISISKALNIAAQERRKMSTITLKELQRSKGGRITTKFFSKKVISEDNLQVFSFVVCNKSIRGFSGRGKKVI